MGGPPNRNTVHCTSDWDGNAAAAAVMLLFVVAAVGVALDVRVGLVTVDLVVVVDLML